MVAHVNVRHHPALEFDTIIAQKHDVLFDKICVALRADEFIEKLNKKAMYVEYENSEFAIPIVVDNKLLGHYVRLDGIVATLRSVDISDDKITAAFMVSSVTGKQKLLYDFICAGHSPAIGVGLAELGDRIIISFYWRRYHT